MRLVRTLIKDEDKEAVLQVLNDENIDYIVSKEASDRGELVVVEFPVPEQALEVVLEKFKTAGHGEHHYTVVADAKSALSTNMGEMEERFIVGEEADDSIAAEELRSQALELLPNAFTFLLLTFLSAVVATAGLLLDSPAFVVGSMVIAPLVGSALTASVGTVLSNRKMIVDGFTTQVYGLGIAIIGAIMFSLVLKTGHFLSPSLHPGAINQIAQRISPGLLSLIIGVCAGAAGAAGLATGISAALVGVMIAAALIPAAAAVGIGIAWNSQAIALGSLILLVVNAASIHVSGVAVFWYLGYRPDWWEPGAIRPNFKLGRIGPSLVVAIALLVLFVTAGGAVSTHVGFEQSVNEVVGETLSHQQYQELTLMEVRAEFNQGILSNNPQEVTVVVKRPPGQNYPRVSEQLKNRISTKTGRQVTVSVEFVDRQQA
ncbi:TIGR00341 family protein [Haladaptatus caseinilyticus]|uniref:TIGR00341 family protein n=1 Tax=Haladaptatus caseinilyticus TaxID=2993314 RepID=UPI00224A6283|nr:TIGR00341 family protein [Haladaptatus caseinilyticus]